MTIAAGPVPVAVLTGFLGAGKTTLLNGWLRLPALASTAVIVNEFGEVGVDHALIEAVRGDLLALTTGCVCCAARGDLVEAVGGLLARRRAGLLDFDRIIVETTGLADPGPVLNALLLDPGLAGAAWPAGVLTLVSAPDGRATLDRHAEARRQVALADRVLITKTDLPEVADEASRLVERVASLNPAAEIGDARRASDDASALLAPSIRAVAPPPALPHHHHAADARIRSVVLDAGPIDAARLQAFITLLFGRTGEALLRLKGLAAIRGDLDRPTVIQAVGPLLHPPMRLAGWPTPEPRTRLVAILDGADPAGVKALWDDVVGPPAIDRPDAAALMSMHQGEPGLF